MSDENSKLPQPPQDQVFPETPDRPVAAVDPAIFLINAREDLRARQRNDRLGVLGDPMPFELSEESSSSKRKDRTPLRNAQDGCRPGELFKRLRRDDDDDQEKRGRGAPRSLSALFVGS